MRYAPLYILSFALCAPRKILEAMRFQQHYRRYEEIQNIPDRLRWCRHSRGLRQVEVAEIAGVTRSVYIDIECGITQHIPRSMMERLADFYGVPMTDFMDEFNQFLYDGQANRIRTCREGMGLSQKSFSQATGIPLTSLRAWEDGTKVISRRCWEQYCEGRM